MPRYEITSPEGKRFEVTAPEGATQEEVLAYAQQQFSTPKRDIAAEIANDPITKGAQAAQVPNTIEQLGRQTLMTGRHLLGAFGGDVIADKLQLPRPENTQERIVGDAARAMAQGSGIASLAGRMAPYLQGVPQSIASLFATNTPTTILANAAGGGAGGMAREAGAGPMGQTGASLAAAMAVPLLSNAGSAAVNYAKNNIGSSKSFAARLANEIAGDKRGEILNLLKSEAEGPLGEQLTAGQAAAPAGRAEFSGLERTVAPNQASGFDAIQQAQNEARANALRSFGGTPADIRWYEQGRNAVTSPMREEALSNANVAGIKGKELAERLTRQQESLINAIQDKGRFQTMAAQQENLANGGVVTPNIMTEAFTPPPNATPTGRLYNAQGAGGSGQQSAGTFPNVGNARTPYRYSPNEARIPEALSAASDTANIEAARRAQTGLTNYQLQSIEAHGLSQLDPSKIVGHIDRILSTPGDRASPLNEKVLTGVRDLVENAVKKGNGVLDVRDLYQIRKEGVNDVVNVLTKDADASTKLRAGSLVNSIKQQIDDAIESALGNTGEWSGPGGYLRTYADMSKGIDRMKVGQFLAEKLTSPMSDQGAGVSQRAAMYAQALRDAPGTLKRSTGMPRYEELGQVLTPEQVTLTSKVGQSLARGAENERLGSLGAKKAQELINAIEPPLPSAGMLSPVYSVLRAITNRIHGSVTSKVTETLAKAMQDPKAMAALMESATPAERKILAPYLLTSPILTSGQAAYQGTQQ